MSTIKAGLPEGQLCCGRTAAANQGKSISLLTQAIVFYPTQHTRMGKSISFFVIHLAILAIVF